MQHIDVSILAQRVDRLEELLMFTERRAEQAEAMARELSDQVAKLYMRIESAERRITSSPASRSEDGPAAAGEPVRPSPGTL